MNTTMADGASEHLDAQIADALFGQPGMSKLDVANRLRQLRGNGKPLLCGNCYGLGMIGYTSGQTPEQFEQGEYPCPDCAQLSPAGQDELQLANEWRHVFDGDGHDMAGANKNTLRRFIQVIEVLAARQPVGEEPVGPGGFVIGNGSGDKYMAWGQVGPEWVADRSAALWLVRRADAEALAAENEDAWLILPVERCALPPNGWACTLASGHEGPCPTIAASPAQAVDLPYSLDADPAGIRAHVCDVITGTLMVGSQGHTPPPEGHWAERFWHAARADAGLQVKMREALWAAARSLRTIADSTKETEFLETAGEIRAYADSRANFAEQVVTESQGVKLGY